MTHLMLHQAASLHAHAPKMHWFMPEEALIALWSAVSSCPQISCPAPLNSTTGFVGPPNLPAEIALAGAAWLLRRVCNHCP